MTYKPATPAPATGIYWCSVCKLPAAFSKDRILPMCKNKCGRGRWELVKTATEPPAKS
jgi:hypothetical protein